MPTLQAAPMLGQKAPAFDLPGTDGKTHSLADVAGRNGTVVAFICNHCPYVKAVAGRMVADAKALAAEGIGFVAISANDPVSHPDDSFPNMKLFAEKYGFPFPYLFDASQQVARAWDAACTPEFYGIDKDGVVAYHGRLDEGRKDLPPAGAKRELLDAMRMIAKTGQGPAEQFPSVGCSIKWKAA
ncbi:MAG: thioredoxin family protein [Dongiaceae bacterium]